MRDGKPEVCDIVEYNFCGQPRTWRVSFHLRIILHDIPTRQPPRHGSIDRLMYDFCALAYINEQYRREAAGLPANRKFRYQICTLEEATHLALVGVCGASAPIQECQFIKTVDWPAIQITTEQQNAVSEFWMSKNNLMNWEWE